MPSKLYLNFGRTINAVDVFELISKFKKKSLKKSKLSPKVSKSLLSFLTTKEGMCSFF